MEEEDTGRRTLRIGGLQGSVPFIGRTRPTRPRRARMVLKYGTRNAQQAGSTTLCDELACRVGRDLPATRQLGRDPRNGQDGRRGGSRLHACPDSHLHRGGRGRAKKESQLVAPTASPGSLPREDCMMLLQGKTWPCGGKGEQVSIVSYGLLKSGLRAAM